MRADAVRIMSSCTTSVVRLPRTSPLIVLITGVLRTVAMLGLVLFLLHA